MEGGRRGAAMSDGDLTSFGASLEAMFRKMGMSDPMALSRLASGWDELAGTPWSGRSRASLHPGRRPSSWRRSHRRWWRSSRYGSADLVAALGGSGRRRDREDRGAGTAKPMTGYPLIDSF